MNDLPHVDLAALSARDLRLLLNNAQRSGRTALAAAAARELADRDPAEAGSPRRLSAPARPSEPPKRRLAVPVAVAAVAIIVTGGGAWLARTWTPPSEPAREVTVATRSGPSAAVRPRANLALAPEMASTARKPTAASPAAQVAESPRSKARAVEVTTAGRASEALERAERSKAPALAKPPAGLDAQPPATGGVVLAVSRSPSLAGADCRGLEGSERMVCEDGRRAAASTRLARASTAPVRVSIARSEGAGRLMPPGAASNMGPPQMSARR